MKGLAELIAEDAAESAKRPDGFEGGDWWQLSEAEERIFSIDLERFPSMVSAFSAWEAFFIEGLANEWGVNHEDALKEARAQRPDIVEMGDSVGGFSQFAAAFGGLTYREAWQMYAKHRAWLQRHGILEFTDGS